MTQIYLTVPALERLIGDDKEMEIKLKDGVIYNFVDKYLRNLLKDEFLKNKINELTRGLQEEATKVIKKEFGTLSTGYSSSFSLNKEFSSHLASLVKSKVDEEVSKVIMEKVEAVMSSKRTEEYIDRYVNSRIQDLTNDLIDKRAKELLSKAISK